MTNCENAEGYSCGPKNAEYTGYRLISVGQGLIAEFFEAVRSLENNVPPRLNMASLIDRIQALTNAGRPCECEKQALEALQNELNKGTKVNTTGIK